MCSSDLWHSGSKSHFTTNIEGNVSMTNSSEQSKAAPKPSRIGEILVEEKVVTEDQLKRALKVQAAMEQGRQLSEIFVELGYATKKAISVAIAKHGKSLRIGDMLVEQGIITEEDVDKAIGIQKEKSIPFGEVLLELGLINERILLINLEIRRASCRERV